MDLYRLFQARGVKILLQKRALSTSNVLWMKKRRHLPRRFFEDKEAFQAHLQVSPRQRELFNAQRRRKQWDYPLGDDQRATWKHRRWFDPHLKKWVSLIPRTRRREFSIYRINRRTMIHEQETLENKLRLLLDKDVKKKYIISPLNMQFARNSSYYYQYLTHTKFVHGMPYNIEAIQVEENVIENFEKYLTSALQLEYYYNINTSQEKSRKKRADRILSSIIHPLMDVSSSHGDFECCELDRNAENSMFWQRGKGFHKYTMRDDLPVTFQSHDNVLYQIRTKKPLPEFSPWMEDFMLTGEIPSNDFLPTSYAIQRKRYRNTITPGFRFKAGDVEKNYHEALEQGKLLDLPPPATDPCQHGHTQLISLPESFDRKWYEANLEHCDLTDQMEEHIKSHGMMSGWTWSAAFAHYMGHWMDDDIKEPICVQTIVSDGQYFAFFCYQLNTVAIDPQNMDYGTHEKRNLCYGTPMIKLYDRVEGTNDIQIYRNASTLLLKFLHNHSSNKAGNEEMMKHNASLEVQEWDTENPVIELQKPKHIREKETALELARQLEIEKNKGITTKILDWVKT